MLRRRHFAIASIWVVSLVVVAMVAVTLNASSGSGAGRRLALQTVATDTGSDLTTAKAPPSTSTSTSTVPPTTTPPTTAAPVTTVPAPPATTPPTTPRTVRLVPITASRPAVAVTPPRTTPPAPSRVTGGDASDYSLEGYRWNPCNVITVESSGPDVAGIVSELASITGLKLQMVSGPAAEITVQWGPVPAGGDIGATVWRAVGSWLTSSQIVISPAAQPYLATVLRHELGHAVGLGHAPRPNEVMYPTVGSSSPTDYQAGDIAGLHAIGAAAGGC
jgi:hypothetical protein